MECFRAEASRKLNVDVVDDGALATTAEATDNLDLIMPSSVRGDLDELLPTAARETIRRPGEEEEQATGREENRQQRLAAIDADADMFFLAAPRDGGADVVKVEGDSALMVPRRTRETRERSAPALSSNSRRRRREICV